MLLKKIVSGLLFILVFLGMAILAKAQETKKIYFFYGTGCPHCAQVLEYFEKRDLFNKYPVEKMEIYFDHNNALLFNQMLASLGIDENSRGVPTVIIDKKVLIGDKPIIDNFVSEADKFLSTNKIPEDNQVVVEIKESNKPLDLTLAAVVAGSLVDAINPCEFAVLIILMTTILASGNYRRAFRSGLAFSASIFISYFLMGLGLYKALSIGGVSGTFFKFVGWVAIVLGVLNLKDYFWYGKGFLMEVPLSWRPRLKELIHSVTGPVGAFFIGFLVSLFLLPCTGGPYIVILGMLAKKSFDTQAILYLLVYNLIFVSPMVLISLAVYKGFDPQKAEEIRKKRLETLHLIAGVVMLGMGAFILMGWI
jgi:cytochrome c biogenesis protein CcdA/glutaredoxin